ncbi:MAG TPA: cupin domain-containing protein [Bryobacteraceae bacterium]|nr:cupin domain-containing protein [Bryobacteraceae bacterium]
MTRRDLTTLLPALATMGTALADAQTKDATAPLTLHSGVFQFNTLPVHNSSGGAATRPILHGKLATGELVELHETTLQPGQMPHAAHRHVHTEFMLIREGSVELILDGKSEQAGPGDVVYAASRELHGLKNTGTVPANYFVIAIGPDIAA